MSDLVEIMQQSNLEFVENGEGGNSIVGQEYTETSSFFPYLSNRLLHLFDYIAILRPLLLIPAWTMLFLGYYKGLDGKLTGSISSISIGNMPVILRPDNGILITIFLYSLLMGSVYILNQISDSYTDKINDKLYLVSEGYMEKKNLKIQIGVLLSISVIIAFFQFPRTYFYLILLSIVFGVLYSVPPIRLKGRPILDMVVNASGFGVIAFAVGWTSKSVFSTKLILDCLPYAICISAAFINTTLLDIKGDIQNGDITTGVFLGVRKSCMAGTLLVGTAFLVSSVLRDSICLIASLLSLPFFIYMTVSNWDERSPNIPAITLATRVSLLGLSVLIAVFIPLYFILLIATILMMRVYYQMRFAVSYP